MIKYLFQRVTGLNGILGRPVHPHVEKEHSPENDNVSVCSRVEGNALDQVEIADDAMNGHVQVFTT